MNRRGFLKSAGGVLIAAAPAIVCSKGLFRGPANALPPTFPLKARLMVAPVGAIKNGVVDHSQFVGLECTDLKLESFLKPSDLQIYAFQD